MFSESFPGIEKVCLGHLSVLNAEVSLMYVLRMYDVYMFVGILCCREPVE